MVSKSVLKFFDKTLNYVKDLYEKQKVPIEEIEDRLRTNPPTLGDYFINTCIILPTQINVEKTTENETQDDLKNYLKPTMSALQKKAAIGLRNYVSHYFLGALSWESHVVPILDLMDDKKLEKLQKFLIVHDMYVDLTKVTIVKKGIFKPRKVFLALDVLSKDTDDLLAILYLNGYIAADYLHGYLAVNAEVYESIGRELFGLKARKI